jgi:tyrosinase
MSSVQFTYRRSIENMSSADLQNLRMAYSQMMTIRDNRGYNFFAGIHGVPGWYCWHHQRARRFNVALRLFLPWHRAYLYMFEQAARDTVPDAFIPWWDWRSETSHTEGIPRAFAEQDFDGQPNPLAKAHISVPNANPPTDRDTRRFPGDPSELPTSSQVNFALSLSDYGDFSDELEGIHDGVHIWAGGIGGDMAAVPFAAWDPIFWSHHSMIDRIWWLWQLRHGINNIPSELLDQELAPFPFTVRRVLNVHELGYDYAGTVTMVGGTTG